MKSVTVCLVIYYQNRIDFTTCQIVVKTRTKGPPEGPYLCASSRVSYHFLQIMRRCLYTTNIRAMPPRLGFPEDGFAVGVVPGDAPIISAELRKFRGFPTWLGTKGSQSIPFMEQKQGLCCLDYGDRRATPVDYGDQYSSNTWDTAERVDLGGDDDSSQWSILKMIHRCDAELHWFHPLLRVLKRTPAYSKKMSLRTGRILQPGIRPGPLPICVPII